MPLTPGASFGPYRIIDSLGRGGMASVYKAYEAALDRYVALKVLPSEFLHDETFAERLFVIAGLSVLAGKRANDHPLGHLVFFVLVAGFAAIGNWIAFGPGPRPCSVGVTGFLFSSTRLAAELECRGAFGVGAVMLDGILFWMTASGLRRLVGPGLFSDRVGKLGEGVLLLCLAPILIPLLLLLLGKVVFEGIREYAKTGRWPRNEAFIARMKKRGAA